MKALVGDDLADIRRRLGMTQEAMARLLRVSFVSVNRWERKHSFPTGSTLDLYTALAAALDAGHKPQAILKFAETDRGAFLYELFKLAYAKTR